MGLREKGWGGGVAVLVAFCSPPSLGCKKVDKFDVLLFYVLCFLCWCRLCGLVP